MAVEPLAKHRPAALEVGVAEPVVALALVHTFAVEGHAQDCHPRRLHHAA